MQGLLTDPWSQLVVADLPRDGDAEDNFEDSLPLGELEKSVQMLEERLTMGEEEEELVVEEFKQIPPPTMDYTKFNLQAGFKEVTFCTVHCSQKGPYFRDRVPIGTFYDFLGPYWAPIHISRSLFSKFWINSREECQSSLHVRNNE